MAKTIKEMAIAYGKVNYIVRYTADGDKEIDEDTGAEFFEDGANAVLEAIESCLGEFYSPDDYHNIKCKIKELKGE